MRHVRCYTCNKLGHIAKEWRKKVWALYQKEKTLSSHFKMWKKKEVKSERGSIAQHIDITESEGARSVKLQCPKSHMQVS